jgi:hypothetical protein
MYTQYWVAGDMLKILKVMDLSETKRFTLQHNIYRLKLMILKNDGRNETEFAKICPLFEMERIRGMFYQLAESPESDELHDQLVEELCRILARVEENTPSKSWNTAQQQPNQSRPTC